MFRVWVENTSYDSGRYRIKATAERQEETDGLTEVETLLSIDVAMSPEMRGALGDLVAQAVDFLEDNAESILAEVLQAADDDDPEDIDRNDDP